MPHPLTPVTGSFPTVNVPSAGDNRTAASVETPFQQLLDGSANNDARLTVAEPKITDLIARTPGARPTFEYILPMFGDPTIGVNPNTWVLDGSGWAAASNSQSAVWIPMGPFPRSQGDAALYLKEVMVVVKGGAGHIALPTVKAKLEVRVMRSSGGALLASANDGSANVAAYEVEHSIFCALSHEIQLFDPGGSLWLVMWNENAANSLAGLTLYAAKAVVSETP
jgi:hypothetical protein